MPNILRSNRDRHKSWQPRQTLFTLSLAACCVCAIAKPARGATLTPGTTLSTFLECLNDGISLVVGQNPLDEAGWQYAIDSSSDGVTGVDVGGNAYEIYSMGIKETDDSIYVAINANTPYAGNPETGVQNGTIALGDLFIDSNGTNFRQASAMGNLSAVRFVANNESGVPELGLYGNVTAKSVTATNAGFESIAQYNQHVLDYEGTPDFGDLGADTDYFDANQSLNAIASGDFLGNIALLSASDLTSAGFNWQQAPGSHTVGFKFNKAALSVENETESVPEPGAIAGLGLLGGAAICRHFRKKA
jgi:hypothetical protein